MNDIEFVKISTRQENEVRKYLKDMTHDELIDQLKRLHAFRGTNPNSEPNPNVGDDSRRIAILESWKQHWKERYEAPGNEGAAAWAHHLMVCAMQEQKAHLLPGGFSRDDHMDLGGKMWEGIRKQILTEMVRDDIEELMEFYDLEKRSTNKTAWKNQIMKFEYQFSLWWTGQRKRLGYSQLDYAYDPSDGEEEGGDPSDGEEEGGNNGNGRDNNKLEIDNDDDSENEWKDEDDGQTDKQQQLKRKGLGRLPLNAAAAAKRAAAEKAAEKAAKAKQNEDDEMDGNNDKDPLAGKKRKKKESDQSKSTTSKKKKRKKSVQKDKTTTSKAKAKSTSQSGKEDSIMKMLEESDGDEEDEGLQGAIEKQKEETKPAGRKGRKGHIKAIQKMPTPQQVKAYEELKKECFQNGECIHPKKYRVGTNELHYKFDGIGYHTKTDSSVFPGVGTDGSHYYESTGIKPKIEELFGGADGYQKWQQAPKYKKGEKAPLGQEDWKSEKIERMMGQECHLVDPDKDNIFACVKCLNTLVNVPIPGVQDSVWHRHKCKQVEDKKEIHRMIKGYEDYKNMMQGADNTEKELEETREEMKTLRHELTDKEIEIEELKKKLQLLEEGGLKPAAK